MDLSEEAEHLRQATREVQRRHIVTAPTALHIAHNNTRRHGGQRIGNERHVIEEEDHGVSLRTRATFHHQEQLGSPHSEGCF